MAEPARIKVFCEGDDDRAVLDQLRKGGLIHESLEIARKVQGYGGKDDLARLVLPHLPTTPTDGLEGRVIVLRDLDDLQSEQIGLWFQEKLGEELKKNRRNPTLTLESAPGQNARVALLEVSVEGPHGRRVGRVVTIAVGAPADAAVNHGIAQFAVDDYVLRLARLEQVYAAVQTAETKSDFGVISHAIAMHKLSEVVALLRENGIPIRHSKRLVQVLRGITDFRANNATFAERFVKKAQEQLGQEEVRAALQPLVGDIEQAVQALMAPRSDASAPV